MEDILRFHPIYKQKIWGGRKLENFQRDLPPGKIGESWEISDFQNDRSIIKFGRFSGRSFRSLVEEFPIEVLGVPFQESKEFPLLVKIIDAEDKLSVQVHPDKEYSIQYDPTNPAKKEAWIILDANEGAQIVCGFNKNSSREDYSKKVKDNSAEEDLYYWSTKKGDSFLINPGTIHAIGAGNLILEIQESSDSTYRVYDYGRLGDDGKPRDLHLEKALDVLNFQKSEGKEYLVPKLISSKDCIRNLLTKNDRFQIETMEFFGEVTFPSLTEIPIFHIVTVIEGNILVKEEAIKTGETFLITASGMKKGIKLNSKEKTKLVISVPIY
jgi:mannose-6-phosphate isomerase